jgi:hypothetical protein
MLKAPGAVAWGHAWAGGFGGGPPKTPRGWALAHWYPPGGGGGPKMRHLVLYKLAGFSPADRSRRRAFFSLHSSPLTFDFLSKMTKKCTFWHNFDPKNPNFPLFPPFFCTFFAKFRGGRDTPFFGGVPENPTGVSSRSLVPPRGGWGAENAAFSTV